MFRRAFTLIELVVVVVILGIIAAVAIPRVSVAVENARFKQLRSSTIEVEKAIELYKADHQGRSPAHDADGSINNDWVTFLNRLLDTTDMNGSQLSGGTAVQGRTYGPYLQSRPYTPFSTCQWIRIDGASEATGCGWRYSTDTGILRPDHASALEDVNHPLH